MFPKAYLKITGGQLVGEGLVQGSKYFDTYRVGPFRGSTVFNLLVGVAAPFLTRAVRLPSEIEDVVAVAASRSLVEGAISAYEDLTAGAPAPTPTPAKMVYMPPEVFEAPAEPKKKEVKLINVD